MAGQNSIFFDSTSGAGATTGATTGAGSFGPAIGLGLQAFSSIAGILAKRDSARLNAFIAGKNAEVKEIEARIVKKQTDISVAQKRRESRAFSSTQRALIGVSGITSGSFDKVTEQTIRDNELDALAVRFRGMVAEGDIKAGAGQQKIAEVIEKGKARKAGFESLLSGLSSSVKIGQELKRQGVIK